MKIAIQAADLDAKRIDGTRVYILNLLKKFGQIDSESQFVIYHKNKFNPELIPPNFSNYKIVAKNLPSFWTQICFAWQIWKDKPDALWMPMHNIPLIRSRKIKTFVTIHDLAFKHFPKTFPLWGLLKINFLTSLAVRFSDKIITISEASKKDILKFYPFIPENKIKVIYHGFDGDFFRSKEIGEALNNFLAKYALKKGEYLLYVGAIQPRKNLNVLISAFEKIKKEKPHLKLVLGGEKAWLWDEIEKRIAKSEYKNDIIVTGTLKFEEVKYLFQNASIFIFPSFYEGFGLPVLEAFASEVPVILANNSSLPEVGGGAAEYFEPKSSVDLAEKIGKILNNETLRAEMISRGLEQNRKFSWEKCAKETLDYMKS